MLFASHSTYRMKMPYESFKYTRKFVWITSSWSFLLIEPVCPPLCTVFMLKLVGFLLKCFSICDPSGFSLFLYLRCQRINLRLVREIIFFLCRRILSYFLLSSFSFLISQSFNSQRMYILFFIIAFLLYSIFIISIEIHINFRCVFNSQI